MNETFNNCNIVFLLPTGDPNYDSSIFKEIAKLLKEGTKVSDAEHMARGEGRATSRPGSGSESSTKPSKEKWEERMFSSFCTVPVQLDDREKAYGTKAVSPAYF